MDPLDRLAEQARTRVPELIPIRYGRMAASPFAYFRGAALPMAADLAEIARSGVRAQLCGDAHLSNFGGFASPERILAFDVNDFDETNPGPFEWDVKRLAAGLDIAGRGRGFDTAANRAIVLQAVRTYRETVRYTLGASQARHLVRQARLAGRPGHLGQGRRRGDSASLRKAVAKAGSKDRLKARNKLTKMVDGELEFRSDPPLLVPIDDVFHEPEHAASLDAALRAALVSYRKTISSDRRALLNTFRYVAAARKVVGVGSVGTRCWLALFIGRDNDDPLLLQIKEAEASVLERFTTKSTAANHGQRVVEGQRLMQAASDIFLGWQRSPAEDGVTRDFYVRQLWDWKASADVDTMDPELLGVNAGMCVGTLARAHARSGDPVMLAAYLGTNLDFDRALADFAVAYADQNEVDHQALVDAIKDGRIIAESGI